MSQRASIISHRDKSRKPRGTVVQFPFIRSPKSEAATASDGLSPTHSMLTDALRAKDERLNELVHDRERFIHDLQGCVLHSLYAIQTGLNPSEPSGARTPALHIPAGIVRKRVNTLIRTVRDKIFTLERDTATGFELEAELRRLVAICRHFGDMMIALSIDPHTASLLTREESRYLLHIAQAVTFDSVRRSQARRLTIRLSDEDGRVNFSLKEDGKRACVEPDTNDEMGLRSIPAQARRIGGRVAMRTKPYREISVVLDFGPERPRGLHKAAPAFSCSTRTGRAGAKALQSDACPSLIPGVGTQEGVTLI